MDPLTVLIGLVVVVHIILLLFLICRSFTFQGEHVGTVTVCHTVNNKSDDIQVQNEKIYTDTAVQTEDSDLFYTCYDYVETQRQENLLTSEVLDEMVDTFQDSLQHITNRLDKNFQFLTVQLHVEFDSYLQYTLGISTGEVDTVLIRHNLENPSTHDYPTIPDLVTSFYQPITQFENFEITLANEDIQCQAEGRPSPWQE